MDNNILVSAMLLSLSEFPNDKLASFNIAIQLYGKVDPRNIAFDLAESLNLIDDMGYASALPELQNACAIEVNRRVEAGTFK